MLVLAIDSSTPQLTVGIVQVSADSDAKLPTLHTRAQQTPVLNHGHMEQLVPLIQQCCAEAEINPQQLDAVVVGTGPGPFTGLRVGMATAASFASALAISCHGVGSLDAIAFAAATQLELTQQYNQASQPQPNRPLATITDARRREVYLAGFYASDEPVAVLADDGANRTIASHMRTIDPTVLKPDAAAELLHSAFAAADANTDASATASATQQLLHLAGAPTQVEAVAQLLEATATATTNTTSTATQYPEPWALVVAALHQLGGSVSALQGTAEPLVAQYLRRPDAVPPKPKPRSSALPPTDVVAKQISELQGRE